jgi:hypothetical protein
MTYLDRLAALARNVAAADKSFDSFFAAIGTDETGITADSAMLRDLFNALRAAAWDNFGFDARFTSDVYGHWTASTDFGNRVVSTFNDLVEGDETPMLTDRNDSVSPALWLKALSSAIVDQRIIEADAERAELDRLAALPHYADDFNTAADAYADALDR